jgi:hypothetical protein
MLSLRRTFATERFFYVINWALQSGCNQNRSFESIDECLDMFKEAHLPNAIQIGLIKQSDKPKKTQFPLLGSLGYLELTFYCLVDARKSGIKRK